MVWPRQFKAKKYFLIAKVKNYFFVNVFLVPGEELEKLSLTYFLQSLECVLMWARWFPHELKNPKKKSKFLLAFEDLKKMGCVFTKTLRFFVDDDFYFGNNNCVFM